MTTGRQAGLAAAALLALAVGLRAAHHFNAPRLLHAGDRLVPLRLSSLAGGDVTLRPQGRAQLINVFATWCPPCRMETPSLVGLAKRLRARGIDVVGIDQQESAAQVQRFRDEFALPYPIYIDPENLTHAVLGARVIPETVYVGADGVIRWIHEGPLTSEQIRSIGQSTGSTV